jgi:hypothetical protein
VTSPRALALRAALALSSLTGDRLAKIARRVLGEARFVALTGAEGNGARDSAGALPVSAGRHTDDAASRTFPLVLVVLTGATREQLEDVVARVATIQREGARVRPVFVIDTGDLAVFRPHGYVVDHVLDRATLHALSPGEDHATYVAGRVDALERLYGSQRTVRADLTGDVTGAAFLATLVDQVASAPGTARP